MSYLPISTQDKDFLIEFIEDELSRDANQYSMMPEIHGFDPNEWDIVTIIQYLVENEYDWRHMLDTENNRLFELERRR
jgi:hypothetical protein